MRILLAHNYYGSRLPSGENRVFLQEKELLESRGHEVRVVAKHNDEAHSGGLLGAVAAAAAATWSVGSALEMRARVLEFRPHVVHAHNTFPLLSPSIFRAARPAARVLTLHNYRLFCAEATTTRGGQPCDKCLTARSSVPGLRHACYRGSRLASLPVAASISLHRRLGTWRSEVDAFVALTEFQRDRLVRAGLDGQKVAVKPNFISGDPAVVPWSQRQERVVYAGRISSEKGVGDLVAAWMAWGVDAPELLLVGDGPQRASLQVKVAEAGATNINFIGRQDASSTQELIGNSRLIVLPSLVTESFGLPIIEGFSKGTPALVSDRGPLQDIAGAGGHVFRAGDADDLLSKAQALWNSQGLLEAMGSEGKKIFVSRFTEDENYRQLMAIYAQAIQGAASRGRHAPELT